MKLRFLVPLLLFALLAVLLGVGLKLDPREVPSPLIGKLAPDFTLPSLGNVDKMLSPKDMQGKVWLMNVWATWCVSCRAEHETLVWLGRQKVAPILGLNYKDESDAAKRWLSELGNPYFDNAVDADGSIAIDWGVYGAPETYVIDKQGIIRHKHIGPLTPDDVNSTIIPMVAQLQTKS